MTSKQRQEEIMREFNEKPYTEEELNKKSEPWLYNQISAKREILKKKVIAPFIKPEETK